VPNKELDTTPGSAVDGSFSNLVDRPHTTYGEEALARGVERSVLE
jgi:hypothetical protein